MVACSQSPAFNQRHECCFIVKKEVLKRGVISHQSVVLLSFSVKLCMDDYHKSMMILMGDYYNYISWNMVSIYCTFKKGYCWCHGFEKPDNCTGNNLVP